MMHFFDRLIKIEYFEPLNFKKYKVKVLNNLVYYTTYSSNKHRH